MFIDETVANVKTDKTFLLMVLVYRPAGLCINLLLLLLLLIQ